MAKDSASLFIPCFFPVEIHILVVSYTIISSSQVHAYWFLDWFRAETLVISVVTIS